MVNRLLRAKLCSALCPLAQYALPALRNRGTRLPQPSPADLKFPYQHQRESSPASCCRLRVVPRASPRRVSLYLTGDNRPAGRYRQTSVQLLQLPGYLAVGPRPRRDPYRARARNSMRKPPCQHHGAPVSMRWLTVRVPVMPRSGIRHALQEPLPDNRREGAWVAGVIRTVMRRRNGGSSRPMSL